jgi:hypothetical protein
VNREVLKTIEMLEQYISKQEFKGYDPYDTLNSWIPFHWAGKWGPPIAIQFQKRNPINIRPLIGIKKGYNPKGMGLLLKSYSLLYYHSKNEDYLQKANWIYAWLLNNYSTGFSGMCWGYNFDWASPGDFIPAYTPSVVATSFVVDGLYEYYKLTKTPKAKEAILSAAKYICKDIKITTFPQGKSYSYTHISEGCCYNASLLAAEILAKADKINNRNDHSENINLAIDFVLSKQKTEGEWWYSYNPKTNSERKQIDFHQGFVLVSLYNLNRLLSTPRKDVDDSIKLGLQYYRKNQFFENGQSLWRIPKKWPVDIHNQSQGIITFTKLEEFNGDYGDYAKTIAEWTIKNMQSPHGFFYYRKNRILTNRIPYMRWSQAWMLLALTELVSNE